MGKNQYTPQIYVPASKFDSVWLLKIVGTGIIWFTNSESLWTSTLNSLQAIFSEKTIFFSKQVQYLVQ